ncbi:hypothetical protein RMR16_006215 [Agrobacterium sp. rho-13.3]|jgi:hypothetical protein|uniref:hypothetical protein n=1 Tax=Agrobacterium sp. rho-13.3 TaxID=3072980 RepID=UPI002A0B5CF3|nr:hypothetical protein [Agrobacterium sp. rho-13.3]MDX8309382.1 hypothetical protein [Agrobacterium sp. rho-13.3]
MILEPIGTAHIGFHGARIAVPGHFHDARYAGPVLYYGCDEASAPRVARKAYKIKASSLVILLHHQRNGLRCKRIVLQAVTTLEAAEDWARDYTGSIKPLLEPLMFRIFRPEGVIHDAQNFFDLGFGRLRVGNLEHHLNRKQHMGAAAMRLRRLTVFQLKRRKWRCHFFYP